MKQIIFVDGSGDGRFCWYNETTNIGNSYKMKDITSNQAEYLAIEKALENVPNNSEIEILSDSQLVVNQLNRIFHIKEDKLREFFDKIQNIIKEKKLKVTFVWIPRKNNKAGKYLG
ncbi:MAG: reverse transcriptase-like protein [Candidatus Omnitrophica bacterium]|nr:reverse transcriptase-like protein [Candidatus Omnitrophota bacterium]